MLRCASRYRIPVTPWGGGSGSQGGVLPIFGGIILDVKKLDKILNVDTVISALGTSANPVIAQTTPGLKINQWGYIVVDEATMATSLPGVYAGGDIVTGAATVILAMGAGRTAAAGILGYLGIAAQPAAAAGPATA